MIDKTRRTRALATATLAGLQHLRQGSHRGWSRGRLRAALALGILVLTLSVGAPAGYAATFTVTNTNNSGPGSLRQAVLDANALPGPDTITFAVTGTITLTSGQLTITDHLMIDGPGAASLTISGGGCDSCRVIEVSATVMLDLRDVTVANGRFVAAPQLAGAGILNFGTLTVSNTTFSGNDAGGCCFGLAGGAIASSGGTVTVSNSTFSGNVAGGSGGAIYSEAGALTVSTSTVSQNSTNDHGGGIFNTGGPATVSNSTFSGNSAAFGGAGIWNNVGGTLVVTNATLSENSTPPSGGGMVNFGGTIDLTNTTFSANSAGIGGGGLLNHGAGTATVTNSTFSGNSAGTGGGIWNIDGVLTLRNTIVANSPSGGNCSGVIIDGGGNLQHPGADCGVTITSADPVLGPLAANDGPAPDPPDGPTKTHALLPGSPAIDSAVLVSCPPTDQRGVSRPQGAGCDIGAFEVEVAACPPNGDEDNDGLTDANENLLLTLLGNADSDGDGVTDGNDDANGNGEDDEDEDDDDECPDRDSDRNGEDDEDEDDD